MPEVRATEGEIAVYDALTAYGSAHATAAVLRALRALPVEQRMEAMGMVLYGEVQWYIEEEVESVDAVIDDCHPGAPVFVDESNVG